MGGKCLCREGFGLEDGEQKAGVEREWSMGSGVGGMGWGWMDGLGRRERPVRPARLGVVGQLGSEWSVSRRRGR
jgi:hypothetical protein